MPVYGHAIGLSASAIGTVLGMVALAAFVIRAAPYSPNPPSSSIVCPVM